MSKLNQVHQHNNQVYAHPVAAFQKTIASRVAEDAEFDISPSAVMAHALQTGEPIDLELSVNKYANDGSLVSVYGNMKNKIQPVLLDSHTVSAIIDVPEGVEVPHDHVIEYSMSSGSQQSQGLVSNFFSATAQAEPRLFAPGAKTTIVGDMYDSDRYDDYRRQKMPIASMIVSGISTGTGEDGSLRVGSIELISSHDLPKERTALKFQGVSSYVGDHGFVQAGMGLGKKRETPSFSQSIVPEGYEIIGRQANNFLINIAFLHALWESAKGNENEAKKRLHNPLFLQNLLGEELTQTIYGKYETAGYVEQFPNIFNLLTASSGLVYGSSMVASVYKQSLAMVQGKEIGEKVISESVESIITSTIVMHGAGERYAADNSAAEGFLLLVALGKLLSLAPGVSVFSQVRQRAKKIFGFDDKKKEGPYVLSGETVSEQGVPKYEIVDDILGWNGMGNLVIKSSALPKLMGPFLKSPKTRGSFGNWLDANWQRPVSLPIENGFVISNTERALGTYRRVVQSNKNDEYVSIILLPLDKKLLFLYQLKGSLKASVTPKGKSFKWVYEQNREKFGETLNVNISHISELTSKSSSEDAASSSASSSMASSSSRFGFDDKFTGKKFAPIGNRALTINDVTMAKPTSEQQRSKGSEARSLDFLLDRPLVGAYIDAFDPTPETLRISRTDQNNLFSVEKNNQLVGVAVYDPVINQFRFSNDPTRKEITHSFNVNKNGVSFDENYYATDLDEAIPVRKQIREEIERIRNARGDSADRDSLEEQIFAAKSDESPENDAYPWIDDTERPSGFAFREDDDEGEEEEEEAKEGDEEFVGRRVGGGGGGGFRGGVRFGGGGGFRGGWHGGYRRGGYRRGSWFPFVAGATLGALGGAVLGYRGPYATYPWYSNVRCEWDPITGRRICWYPYGHPLYGSRIPYGDAYYGWRNYY